MHTNSSWNPPEDPIEGTWAPLAFLAKLGDVDINLTLWMSWLLMPIVIFFVLPMAILVPVQNQFYSIQASALVEWLKQKTPVQEFL